MNLKSLYKIIIEKYNLQTSGKLIRLRGGEKNAVYKISNLNYVVRVYQQTAELDGIEFEHKLMTGLSKHTDLVVAPLCFGNESYFIFEGHPVAVLPYLEGSKPIQKDCLKKSFCFNAGKVLGRLHRIAEQYKHELPKLSSRAPLMQMDVFNNHIYDLEKASVWLSSTKFAPELPYIKSELQKLLAYLQKQTLPLIPIHGDYYCGNLIWDKKQITGVIDFDDSKFEWAEFEIARAIWEFTRDDKNLILDNECQKAFLDGYSSERPIKHDLPLYIKIIRLVRLFEILLIATSMVNKDLIGYIYGSIRRDYVEGSEQYVDPKVGYIESIFVLQKYRKQGIARELCKQLEAWAKSQGCSEFASDAYATNKKSRDFHKAIGFKESKPVIHFIKEIL